MSDEVVTTSSEAPQHTTIIERSGGGGGAGIMIGVALLIFAVIAVLFLVTQNRNDAIKTDAISGAAKSIEQGADKIGEAADKAGNAIEGSTAPKQ